MKGSRSNTTQQNKSVSNSHRPQPQNKDDLDSRKNEEQDVKGGDITHNKKDVRNNRQQKKDEE
jgi:hypothetical protein